MSRSMVLCEWCAQIPLDPYILLEEFMEDPHRAYFLGSGARFESSLCPFCQLVVRAFSEGHRDVNKQLIVEAKWSAGPGGRWAFSISGTRADTWIGFGRNATLDYADHQLPHLGTNRDYFVEPTTGPVLDTARILRWVSFCEQKHGPACELPPHLPFADAFRGLRLLRLIDTEAGCLVEKRNLEKYVALSYVWGAVSNFRLTKANRTALLAPGSLNDISYMLPETMKDTIALVRRLGGRYLWVDALCLLQNDTDDLDRGVNAMDLIYERAWLTIVAGCGYDANARLLGVQKGTRRACRNTLEVKPQLEMGVVTGLDMLLKSSVHNSRAWTFQEVVLSRRVIYFVGDKLFYRCRVAEHSEHYADFLSQRINVGATAGSLLPEAILMEDPISDYSTMLFYYTQRVLTNQKDVLRAMTGIIRRFTEAMKCRFLEGLPTALFDRFIIFHAFGTTLHRRSSFPSYSWTGWRGQIKVDHDNRGNDIKTWLRERTWIIWYERSPSGTTNLVWDPSTNDFSSSAYRGYRDRGIFSDGQRISKQLNSRRTMPTEEVSFTRVVPTYPMLQFWTLSVFYTITDINVFQATGYLTDMNNARCGFVWLDGFEETIFFESKGPFEVILLSESFTHQCSTELDRHSNNRYSKVVGQWAYYYVLLLEWQGGIAERRGFGIIFQAAIQNSLKPGPVWKEIFLA